MDTRNIQSTEEALIIFFKQVALRNKALITKIKNEQYFEVDDKKWQFTLPNLYSFLQRHDCAFNSTTYLTFRKILFNSPINQTVKLHDAEICIVDNQNNTDKSIYSLVWMN